MKDYTSLLLHLASYEGFIQQLIEEQWNTINLIKYTNFSTSLSQSSPRYLERSRQHFHSSDLLTDPVFLIPAVLSANVFSTLSPSAHILGSETGRAEFPIPVLFHVNPFPLLPCFNADEEDTRLCWARCPVLSGNPEFTHSGSTVSSAFYMELDGYGCVPL